MRSLCLLAALCPAFGDVYVVDSTGAGDFLDVQSAVDWAVDGDMVVVRPQPGTGAYSDAVVVDKDLRIVAEWGTVPRLAGVRVLDLDSDRQVLLSGLDLGYAGRFEAADCDGALRIHDCGGGMEITGCQNVVVTDSRMVLTTHVLGSQFAAYDTDFEGTSGFANGGDGGGGLILEASFAWLAGCVAIGGEGQIDCGGACYDGGDGLVAIGGSTAWIQDCRFYGGGPGICGPSSFGCEWESGNHGLPLVIDGTSSVMRPEEPRRSLVPVPVVGRTGSVVLEVRGAPGDRVELLRAPIGAWELDHELRGVVHVALEGGPTIGGTSSSHARRLVGVVPADGTLWIEVDEPAVGEQLQVVCIDEKGAVHPGNLLQMVIPPESTSTNGLRRVYVDADAPAGGDGRSWATAFATFTEACDAIEATRARCRFGATEVWLAQGTYTPAPPGGERYRRFFVHGPVRVLGGFAGGETLREQRDPVQHRVVLSGDLNGDDLPDGSNRGDNAWSLLTVGSWSGGSTASYASHIDGIEVSAAMHETGGSWDCPLDVVSGVVSRCVLRGNRSNACRAAVYLSGALLDCRVEDNVCKEVGGADLTSCWAVQGCLFLGNSGAYAGGLRTFVGDRGLTVAGCVFSGNTGGQAGGLLVKGDDPSRVQGCSFHANHGVGTGSTGGLLRVPGADSVIAGCILWGNDVAGVLDEAAQLSGGVTQLRYSCVQGLTTHDGPGNHREHPLFVDPFGPDWVAGTSDDDLRLSAGSPCIDAGDNAYLGEDLLDLDGDGDRGEPLPFDPNGDPRRVDDPGSPDHGNGPPPILDMGAYERQG